MRVREGKNLTKDLLKRLDWIENKRQFLMDHANEAVYAYENRFKARLIELLGGLHIAVDEGRILTEIAAYAEKPILQKRLSVWEVIWISSVRFCVLMARKVRNLTSFFRKSTGKSIPPPPRQIILT